MKLFYLFLFLFSINTKVIAQDSSISKSKSINATTTLDYFNQTQKAYSGFLKNDFNNASREYSIAFQTNDDKGLVKDRYILACCFAKLNESDSAFYQLFRIAEKGGYYNYQQIEKDVCFKDLRQDQRWDKLIALIKKNASKIESQLNSGKFSNN